MEGYKNPAHNPKVVSSNLPPATNLRNTNRKASGSSYRKPFLLQKAQLSVNCPCSNRTLLRILCLCSMRT